MSVSDINIDYLLLIDTHTYANTHNIINDHLLTLSICVQIWGWSLWQHWCSLCSASALQLPFYGLALACYRITLLLNCQHIIRTRQSSWLSMDFWTSTFTQWHLSIHPRRMLYMVCIWIYSICFNETLILNHYVIYTNALTNIYISCTVKYM